MQILINNQTAETKASTLIQLAEELALPIQGVAIAVNNRMIPRSEWNDTPLSEGENVIIIKAAYGG